MLTSTHECCTSIRRTHIATILKFCQYTTTFMLIFMHIKIKQNHSPVENALRGLISSLCLCLCADFCLSLCQPLNIPVWVPPFWPLSICVCSRVSNNSFVNRVFCLFTHVCLCLTVWLLKRELWMGAVRLWFYPKRIPSVARATAVLLVGGTLTLRRCQGCVLHETIVTTELPWQ